MDRFEGTALPTENKADNAHDLLPALSVLLRLRFSS